MPERRGEKERCSVYIHPRTAAVVRPSRSSFFAAVCKRRGRIEIRLLRGGGGGEVSAPLRVHTKGSMGAGVETSSASR